MRRLIARDRQTILTLIILLLLSGNVCSAQTRPRATHVHGPLKITAKPDSAKLTNTQTVQFNAMVVGSDNRAITWSLTPPIGTISPTGLYTAPANIVVTQIVTVKATSMAEPAKFAITTVILSPPPPVSVTVTPPGATLTQSQTQSFSAIVTNTTNTAVIWSLIPVIGSINEVGMYTSPSSIISAQNVTVKATSTADPTKSAIAIVILNPSITVTAAPAAVTLTQSQTQAFSAVANNTGNPAVTWSLNPAAGSISAAGLYTAPASIATPQVVTVRATSVADPTKSALLTVTLVPPITISLTPSSVSLLPSQSQIFTATVNGTTNPAVTWTINPTLASLASNGTTAAYIAPSTAPTSRSGTITAISMADSSKAATAVITLLQAVTVSVSPLTIGLAPNATQQFVATVLGTANTGVTWSINPSVGTISSAGLYTSPSSILEPQMVTITAQSVADPRTSATAQLSLIPPASDGTSFTYYVDSANGTDSNAGTQVAPWKTITKVNLTKLTPGQSVGFVRGGAWREMLVPGQSGTAASPITFGAYGNGPNPILDGSDLVPTWMLYSGNIYESSVTWTPNQLYRNNVALTEVASLSGLATDGQWFYNPSTKLLYVYSTTSLTSATVEATHRNLVASVSQAYIVLNSLHMVKGNQNDLYLSAANNVTISDSELEQAAYAGVNIGGGSYNIRLDGGSVHNNGEAGGDGDGIGVGNQGAASHDLTIENMSIYANGNKHAGNNISIGLTSTASAPYNILIQLNTISSAHYYDGIFASAGTAITARYNLILNNPLQGVELYNTVATPPLTSLWLYNNTIIGSGRYGVSVASIAGTTALTMRNNIIWNNVSGTYAEVGWSTTYGGQVTLDSDYNDIYNTLGAGPFSNGGFLSLAALQNNMKQEMHSSPGNPLFTNASAGIYTLQPGSPAINSGFCINGVTPCPTNIGAK